MADKSIKKIMLHPVENGVEKRDTDLYPVTEISAVLNLESELAGKQATINDLETIRAGAGAGASAIQPEELAEDLAAYYTKTEVDTALEGKQAVISDLANIRSGAAAGATAVQPSALGAYYTATEVDSALAGKVDKVTGKGLSENDYSDADAAKVASAIQPNDNISSLHNDAGYITNSAITVTDIQVNNTSILTNKVANIDTTNRVSENSEALVTSGAVFEAIKALPEPMTFQGSVGAGGEVSWKDLPNAASANKGHTYKVITDHAADEKCQACKVGDTIISNGEVWTVIPSGDEPSGTVTNVGLTPGDGSHITVSGSPVTSSGTITIGIASDYSIPSNLVQGTWSAKQDAISDLSAIRTNAGKGATAIQGIKVNDVELTPDVNKKVNVVVPDAQIQSDWNQTNTSAKDYIKNKPPLGDLAAEDKVTDSMIDDGTISTSKIDGLNGQLSGIGISLAQKQAAVPDSDKGSLVLNSMINSKYLPSGSATIATRDSDGRINLKAGVTQSGGQISNASGSDIVIGSATVNKFGADSGICRQVFQLNDAMDGGSSVRIGDPY